MNTKIALLENDSKSLSNIAHDPSKYNRGQVIHQKGKIKSCNSGTARVSSSAKSYKQNVVENCIAIDWFQAQITVLRIDLCDSLTKKEPTQEIQVSDEIYLTYAGNGTRNFEKLYKVHLYGIEYGTLEFDTRSPQLFDFNSGNIKLHNQILYTSTWLDDFKFIISEMGAKVKSLTRLDIAVDGTNETISIINQWLRGRTIGRKGKASITPRILNSKKIESVIVGSAKSDKQVSIYEKLQEIQKSNKTYITEYWKNSGMDVRGEVWRTELRMSGKVANGYDWIRLDDPEYLASIVRTEFKNYLEFYYQGKDSNKHRTYKKKSMEIINFDSIGGKLLDKRENKPPSDVYRAKQTVKNLLREEYLNANKTVDDILREYSLHEWVESKSPYWYEDWQKEKKVRLMTADIRLSSN